jgi:hypothetical protein
VVESADDTEDNADDTEDEGFADADTAGAVPCPWLAGAVHAATAAAITTATGAAASATSGKRGKGFVTGSPSASQ